jgi:hypothetical protein
MPAVPEDFPDWKKSVDDALREIAGRAQTRPPQNQATTGDVTIGPSQALRVKQAGGILDQSLIGWDGTQRVAKFFRADGSLAFSVATPSGVPQTATIWDGAGNAVLGDDSGGTGLARPYIPMVVAPARTADWLLTVSGTFEDVWRMTPLKINPRGTLTIGHIADASTAGEVQVTVNGSAIGSPTTVGTSQTTTTIGPFALPGAQEAAVEIRVQGRRTSGAGNVRFAVLAATGFHS